MEAMNYVKPELIVVAFVLYFFGVALRQSQAVKNKYIPLILGGISMVLCAVWVMATSEIETAKEGAMAVFTAVTQGILVAGLGNEAVTPDAVGPEALRNLIVTRHLKRTMPEVFAPFSTVSAIAPGVLGTTGMESAELLAAAVRQIQPDAVIAVDAVASCEPERLCAAVQLSTAGITPGSGVGNARAAIDRTTLGVPVLAIGVPTVMDLGGRRMKDGTIPAGMILTPRDIDAKIKLFGRWIGLGIDLALHEGLDVETAECFLA